MIADHYITNHVGGASKMTAKDLKIMEGALAGMNSDQIKELSSGILVKRNRGDRGGIGRGGERGERKWGAEKEGRWELSSAEYL